MRWGEGERGAPPLPAPAPGPDAPRAGARRRDATEPSHARQVPGSLAARARPRLATRLPRYLHTRAPGLRPSPTPCTRAVVAGPGRRLPGIPPHSSLTPRPQPLPVRRRAWPAVRDRKESRHWEVLGEGGAGLKGTTTSFQPGGKKKWGGRGGRSRVALRLNGGNNAKKEREDSASLFPKHPQPLNTRPPSLTESRTVVWESRLIPPGQPSVLLVEVNVGVHIVQTGKWAQGTLATYPGSHRL